MPAPEGATSATFGMYNSTLDNTVQIKCSPANEITIVVDVAGYYPMGAKFDDLQAIAELVRDLVLAHRPDVTDWTYSGSFSGSLPGDPWTA